MSDIVERLRSDEPYSEDLCLEAADEIITLRAEAEKLERTSWAAKESRDAWIREAGTSERIIATLRAEVERLRAEVQTWQGHAKTAVWSDSEECKLLTRINAALLEAPTVDVEVVVPDRDYAKMTPKDCYEAGLLDGVHQAREAIKAAAIRALKENSNE